MITTMFSTLLLLAVETAEVNAGTAKDALTVTLDVAALVGALLWPVALLVIFLTYRKQIPPLVKGIAGRLSKLEFAGVSIELAKAKEFDPQWNTAGSLDLRSKAQAGQVNDSYMMTFRDQLLEEGSWDYAEVDLGDGRQWLTSRLYIMAIVFSRMKGIKALVFLKSSGKLHNRFVCWAEPEKVRWALAKRFPWLEQAYADAYSTLFPQYQAIVVSNEGRLGTASNPENPEPGISLIREYLIRVQASSPPPPVNVGEWLPISTEAAAPITYEHARWLSTRELEDILGADCNKSMVVSEQMTSTTGRDQIQRVISVPGDFVAVVGDGQKFGYLADRTLLLEQVARQVALQAE